MKKPAFTLIEILMSIAIIAIISAIGIPVYQSFQTRNDLDVATVTVVQSLRRAQILAQASDGDSSWGVYATSGSIIIFKGTSYSGRSTSSDEVFVVPASINPATSSEYIYNKFSGLPTATGTINLISITNESRNITINSKGTVSY